MRYKTVITPSGHIKVERISNFYWHNIFSEKSSCLPGVTTTTTFWKFEIQEFPASLIGDTNIIEQHLTEGSCINNMHKSLKIGVCVPIEATQQVIIWDDPHHPRKVMHPLGEYEIQRQGDYILIQDLHAGGAVQAEYGSNKGLLQLDNGLVIRTLHETNDLLKSLKTVVSTYASKVADDVVAPLLEAHIVQSLMLQKNLWSENGNGFVSCNKR